MPLIISEHMYTNHLNLDLTNKLFVNQKGGWGKKKRIKTAKKKLTKIFNLIVETF